MVWLVEDARLRRCRGRRRCAVLVAVRLVVDVDDRLALEDVEDDVEALEFGGRNDGLAEVEVGCQVRGEQLGRERLDELHQLLEAPLQLSAVANQPTFSTQWQ